MLWDDRGTIRVRQDPDRGYRELDRWRPWIVSRTSWIPCWGSCITAARNAEFGDVTVGTTASVPVSAPSGN